MKKASQNTFHNPQFQVLLKLKQSHNPDFSFLDESHSLFPLYQYMIQRWPKVMTSDQNNENEKKENRNHDEKNKNGGLLDYASSSEDSAASSKNEKGTNMGGLLGMYDSSDEEDDKDSTNPLTSIEEDLKERTKRLPDEVNIVATLFKEGKSQNFQSLDEGTHENKKAFDPSFPESKDNNVSSRIEELRKKRLKRAKLKKDHFVSKMVNNKL